MERSGPSLAARRVDYTEGDTQINSHMFRVQCRHRGRLWRIWLAPWDPRLFVPTQESLDLGTSEGAEARVWSVEANAWLHAEAVR